MSETVRCEIDLGEGRAWRGHVPVLRLTWSESDPLAVVVVVGARPAHPALLRGRWVAARDMLRSTLAPGGGAPAGPGWARHGRPVTCRCPGPVSTSR